MEEPTYSMLVYKNMDNELEDQQVAPPHNIYSGAKLIPFSSQRPFHIHCSVGALFHSDQTNTIHIIDFHIIACGYLVWLSHAWLWYYKVTSFPFQITYTFLFQYSSACESSKVKWMIEFEYWVLSFYLFFHFYVAITFACHIMIVNIILCRILMIKWKGEPEFAWHHFLNDPCMTSNCSRLTRWPWTTL